MSFAARDEVELSDPSRKPRIKGTRHGVSGADVLMAAGAMANPHVSPPFYYARRSARCVGAYSLQPARR